MRRLAVRLALAIAAALGVGLLPAQAAIASTPYDYTDPSVTGCASSALTFWSKDLINPSNGAVTGSIEARYSSACQTNWVRINNYVNGATAYKMIQRPASGSIPFAQDVTGDTYYGWSYGLQFYAPSWLCIYVGGTIVLNGQVIGSNGQALEYIC